MLLPYEAYSVGIEATLVRLLAIRSMAGLGIDFSHHTAKTLAVYQGMVFDAVITVCDTVAQTCPSFPGRTRSLHWSLPDSKQKSGHNVGTPIFAVPTDVFNGKVVSLGNPERETFLAQIQREKD